MGTLHNQAPRDHKINDIKAINDFFKEISKLATKHKMSNENIIEGLKVLELRRENNLYVANGDTHDEQMSGIGDEIAKISFAIKDLAEAIQEHE